MVEVAGAYAPPLRASIAPEGLKRTMQVNPEKLVCAPFEIPTKALSGETVGVASKETVNVPVWEAMAVFCHEPPVVAVTHAPKAGANDAAEKRARANKAPRQAGRRQMDGINEVFIGITVT